MKKNIIEGRQFCQQIKQRERFIKIDLSAHEALITSYSEQIVFLETEIQKLNQNNGQNLNPDTLRKLASFAAIFCVETLGFKFPKYNKDGNPILSLLQVLYNIDESAKDIGDIKNQFSQLHQKYQNFKKQPEINGLINTLLDTARNKSDSIDDIRFINMKFRQLLLEIDLKPQFPINIDA